MLRPLIYRVLWMIRVPRIDALRITVRSHVSCALVPATREVNVLAAVQQRTLLVPVKLDPEEPFRQVTESVQLLRRRLLQFLGVELINVAQIKLVWIAKLPVRTRVVRTRHFQRINDLRD